MSLLITRPTIRQKVLLELGGIVDTVASGSTTTIVATNLLDRFYDNNALKNATVYLPDDDVADKQRAISAWDDSTQTITPSTALSDAPDAGDALEIYFPGDPSHHVINQAINRSLQELRRPTFTAIPTREGSRRYGTTELPWVRDKFDILEVLKRTSPNLLSNEDLEYWGTGDSPALAAWVFAGTSGTVTRTESPQAHRPYVATLTRSGNDVTLTQTVGLLDRQLIGKTVTGSVLCTSGDTSAVLSITDGVTTETATHTGGSTYETLSPTPIVISASATTLTFTLQHNTNNTSSSWSRAILVEGAAIDTWLANWGSENAIAKDVRHTKANTPDGAAIVLDRETSRGSQLWVQTAMPFPELDSDTAVTDCPLDAILAFTMVRLARRHRNENQERWTEILNEWAPVANRWQSRLNARSSTSQSQVTVRGA